jgi:hypothetical protein
MQMKKNQRRPKLLTISIVVALTLIGAAVFAQTMRYNIPMKLQFKPMKFSFQLSSSKLFMPPMKLNFSPVCIDTDKDGACRNIAPKDCNDSNASIKPGMAESCDGVDNDCDGQIDEDFTYRTDGSGNSVGETCTEGVGACTRKGILKCSGDGLSVLCTAKPGSPAQEVCNEIDDNCDGQIDENLSLDLDGDGIYAPGSCLQPANDCDEPSMSGFSGGCPGSFYSPSPVDTLPMTIESNVQSGHFDCYRFELSEERDVSMVTTGKGMGECGDIDTVLSFYQGDWRDPSYPIFMSSYDGFTKCAAIRTRLPEGAYKVCVSEPRGGSIDRYVLNIQANIPLTHDTNNNCHTATYLSSASGTIYGSYNGATNNYSPLNINACQGLYARGPDRVFAVDVGAGQTLHANLSSNSGDEVLYLLKDCPYRWDACVAASDQYYGAGQEEFHFENNVGSGRYFIVVDNNVDFATGEFTLTWSVN